MLSLGSGAPVGAHGGEAGLEGGGMQLALHAARDSDMTPNQRRALREARPQADGRADLEVGLIFSYRSEGRCEREDIRPWHQTPKRSSRKPGATRTRVCSRATRRTAATLHCPRH